MDWENWFFIVAIISVLILIFPILDPTSSQIGNDHTYHALKLDLLLRHGFSNFPEIGNLGYEILIPPFLLLFYPLALLIGSRIAYYSIFLAIPFLIILLSKKLGISYRPLFAAILFPLNLAIFFYFGRTLELVANIFLLLLFLYLDKKPRVSWSLLLFFLGMSSHLPTLAIYAIPLLLKSIEKKLHRHLVVWMVIFLTWMGLYLPGTLDKTGIILSRLEYGRLLVNSSIFSGFESLMLIGAMFLVFVLSLLFLKKERTYFFIPITLGIFQTLFWVFNISVFENIPGVNQIVPFTPAIMISYFLWINKRALWQKFAYISFPLFFVGFIFATSSILVDVQNFDFIEGSYLFVSGCRNIVDPSCNRTSFGRPHLENYLAYRGVDSPMSSTWEYSPPEYFFFYPESCEDLTFDVNYFILDSFSFSWAQNCLGASEIQGFTVVPRNQVF